MSGRGKGVPVRRHGGGGGTRHPITYRKVYSSCGSKKKVRGGVTRVCTHYSKELGWKASAAARRAANMAEEKSDLSRFFAPPEPRRSKRRRVGG